MVAENRIHVSQKGKVLPANGAVRSLRRNCDKLELLDRNKVPARMRRPKDIIGSPTIV